MNVSDCNISFNASAGIIVRDGSTVRNCTLRLNAAGGIGVSGSGQIVGNTCEANGLPTAGYGIEVFGDGSRVEGNNCTNNYGGFNIAPNNLVIRNSAHGQGVRNFTYSPIGSNGVAEVIDVVPFGPTFTTTQPWANFSY